MTRTEAIPRKVWRLAVVLAFGGVMAGLDTSVVNVGLDVIGRDLDAALASAQWVQSGYLLALAAALPACGWVSFDGYVFVTPEYNHSTTGVLKNAIDYLYAEWANKSAGFVGYGTHGGLRAVEHLRLVMAELQVADVKTQVALSIFTDFDDAEVAASPRHEKELDLMLGQVVAWAQALAPLRRA